MLKKLEINLGSFKHIMTKKNPKPSDLFIHLVTYVIHINALREKKKQGCARNA